MEQTTKELITTRPSGAGLLRRDCFRCTERARAHEKLFARKVTLTESNCARCQRLGHLLELPSHDVCLPAGRQSHFVRMCRSKSPCFKKKHGGVSSTQLPRQSQCNRVAQPHNLRTISNIAYTSLATCLLSRSSRSRVFISRLATLAKQVRICFTSGMANGRLRMQP